MNHSEGLRDELVEFLNSVARPGSQVEEIADHRNLIDAGIIDSFALIQIIYWLEQTQGMNLQELGIDPAELGSIDGILNAITRAAE